MKKTIIVVALILGLTVLLSGCFGSSGSDTAPDASATPGASAVPGAGTEQTASPQATNNTSAGNANTTAAPDGAAASQGAPYDWMTGAGAVESRIGLFSEIDQCRVVTVDNTALVGVRFADAYQGELTQRIRDMIAGEVMAADSAVQVVAVTAEPGDVESVFQLADRQKQGESKDALKPDVDRIARNTTSLR